jgi:hypothetical protein
MSTSRSADGGKSRPLWRASLCALLIGLVVYNPFAALTSASNGLAYQALARHRASVGASEMQPFAPVKAETAQPDVTVATEKGELPATRGEEARLECGRVHLPLLLEGMTSLWFRPPPRA